MRFITLFFLIICSYGAMGQWHVGGHAGASFSNFKSKTPWRNVTNTGIAVGLVAVKEVRPNVGVTVRLEYVQKGYYHKVCNSIFDKLEANYLELPITIDYHFLIPSTQNWKAHVGLGFYGAYWLSGKYKTRGFDDDDQFDFNEQGYKRFDVGPAAMGRVSYILKNGVVSLDARYEIGVIDMQQKTADTYGNVNKTFVLGFSYFKYLQRQ